jgi:hypothetical protein
MQDHPLSLHFTITSKVAVYYARPPSFITFTITSKVAVYYAPAEWADTLTLFHL